MFYAFDTSSLQTEYGYPIFQIKHLWFRSKAMYSRRHTEIDSNYALSPLASLSHRNVKVRRLSSVSSTINRSGNLRHEGLLFKMKTEGLDHSTHGVTFEHEPLIRILYLWQSGTGCTGDVSVHLSSLLIVSHAHTYRNRTMHCMDSFIVC